MTPGFQGHECAGRDSGSRTHIPRPVVRFDPRKDSFAAVERRNGYCVCAEVPASGPKRNYIEEYNDRVKQIAQESYPEVARLEQVKGVGTLIALTYVLTLEDPRRFHQSRDVGCYLGLRPGRRNSGQSEPQLHISKEGDPYLRTMMVQSAHHILGPCN